MIRNYTFWMALVAVSLVLSAGKGPKLTMTKVAEGVTVGLPKDWFPMTDDDIASKYPSTKKPLAMYTYLDRTANFGVNLSKSLFPGNDPRVLLETYKATIIDSYDKVDWIQCDTAVINGRIYSVYEYTAVFDKTTSYNYLQYTVVQSHIVIFNFECPTKDKDKWAPIAKSMMQSVRLNPKQMVLPEKKQADNRGMSPDKVLQDQKSRKQKK